MRAMSQTFDFKNGLTVVLQASIAMLHQVLQASIAILHQVFGCPKNQNQINIAPDLASETALVQRELRKEHAMISLAQPPPVWNQYTVKTCSHPRGKRFSASWGAIKRPLNSPVRHCNMKRRCKRGPRIGVTLKPWRLNRHNIFRMFAFWALRQRTHCRGYCDRCCLVLRLILSNILPQKTTKLAGCYICIHKKPRLFMCIYLRCLSV